MKQLICRLRGHDMRTMEPTPLSPFWGRVWANRCRRCGTVEYHEIVRLDEEVAR